MSVQPNQTRDNIIRAAVSLATQRGLAGISAGAVAEKTGIAKSTVFHHFSSMSKILDEVMRVAVRDSLVRIVADGLLRNHRVARAAPQDLKAKAAKTLTI